MYCSNCGTQNAEESKFCAGCGAPLNPAPVRPAAPEEPQQRSYYAAPDPYAQPYDPNDAPPAKPKNKKKLWMILAAVGAVAVVAVLLIVLLGGKGGSPESVAEGFVEAIFDGDIDGAVDYIHESMREDMEIEDGFGGISAYLEMIKDIDIKASESEKLSKSDLADLDEELEYEFDNVPEIEEAYRVTVDITMEISFLGQTQSGTESMDIYVGQIDGDWYVVYADG